MQTVTYSPMKHGASQLGVLPASAACPRRSARQRPLFTSVSPVHNARPCVSAEARPRSARRRLDVPSAVASVQGASSDTWDVLGICQVMVDYAAALPDDDALTTCSVAKGGRRVIDVEERASVMAFLESFNTQVSAGGSLANTLVGLSRLGAAASAPKRLRVAMTGCVGGSDALGSFARAQLNQAGVEVLPTGSPMSQTTGTVMVLQTPDAQRSFLSSFPRDDVLELTEGLTAAVARSKLLLLEGYLWELPGADKVLPALVSLARSVGTLVALTAGDAGVVERHASKVLHAIESGVDVFFCNAAEAQALINHLPPDHHQQQHAAHMVSSSSSSSNSVLASSASSNASSDAEDDQEQLTGSLSEAQQAALHLAGICPTVVVTDGSKGSYVTAMGKLCIVPPHWSLRPPVDTTGAGDGYAAGFLYAYLSGVDLHAMGHFASRVASSVIGRYGPQLTHDDAEEAVQMQRLAPWHQWLQQQQQEVAGLVVQQAAPAPAAAAEQQQQQAPKQQPQQQ